MVIKFLIIMLYPLALLTPAPSQHEIAPEQTDEERQEAGVNMMWMAMGWVQ